MAAEQDDILATYIRRVSELSRDRTARLDAAELRDIALELGMTDVDLAAADEAALAHRARGVGHGRYGRWDDAVTELEAAADLAPGDVETIFELAGAHLGRWRARGDGADRQEAERLARRCLELAPDFQPPYRLLNELAPPARPRESRAGLVLALLLGAGALFGIGGLSFWLERAPLPAVQSTLPRTWQATGTVDIPTTLADPAPAGLRLEARLSRLDNYQAVSYYTLQAVLHNTGSSALRKLGCRLELRDQTGTVIATQQIDARAAGKPPLRSGETRPFEAHLQTVSSLHDVRLVIVASG